MKRQSRSEKSVRAMGQHSYRRTGALVLSAAAMAWSSRAMGASGTWNGTTSSTWSTTANWSALPGSTTGFTNADTATFSSFDPAAVATNFTINVDQTTQNVKSLTFDNVAVTSTNAETQTAFTISGNSLLLSSTGTLQATANVNATQTVSASLLLEPATTTTAGTYTFTNSSTFTSGSGALNITGNIAGDANNTTVAATPFTLSLNGANYGLGTISGNISNVASGAVNTNPVLGLTVSSGSTATWILSGTNSFTGATTISGGTLVYSNNNAVSSGSAITVGGGNVIFGSGVTIPSTMTLTTGGVGDAGGIANVVSWVNGLGTAPANLASDSLLIDSTADASTNFDRTTGTNGASMSLGSNGNFTYTGTITTTSSIGYLFGGGSGALTIGSALADQGGSTPLTVIGSGGGSVVVNPLNTYGGNTTIGIGGILVVNNLPTEGAGGVPSSLGESSNASTSLVLNGGTLRYTGSAAVVFDRGFTIGNSSSNSTIDSSGAGALTLSGTIVDNAGSAVTRPLILTGTNTGADTLNTPLDDNGTGGFAGLTKSGIGTWNLAATDVMSGNVTLNAGLLNIANSGALGTGTLVLAGGSFDNTTGSGLTINNPETWTGNFTYVGSNSLNTGTGAVSLTGTRNITVLANTVTIPSTISSTGAFGFNKQGQGSLVVTGSNTFNGPLGVLSGLLNLGTTGSVASGATATTLTLGGLGANELRVTASGSSRTQTFTGALTDNSSLDVITLATDAGDSNTLTLGSLAARGPLSTMLYRGDNLGIAAPGTAGDTNILFTTPPTEAALSSYSSLAGSASLGTTSAAVLRGALIDESSSGNGAGGFATYEPTNGTVAPYGVRALITSGTNTEQDSTDPYPTSSSTLNVRINLAGVGKTITGETTNTLQIDNTTGANTAATLTSTGTTLQPANGLLFTGNSPITLSGGTLTYVPTAGLASSNDEMMVLSTNTAGVTFGESFTNSGTGLRGITFGGPGNFFITSPAITTGGNGGLTFNGPGNVSFTGSTTYSTSSDGIGVNGGTVTLDSTFTYATATVARPLQVAQGGTLALGTATVPPAQLPNVDYIRDVLTGTGVGGSITNGNAAFSTITIDGASSSGGTTTSSGGFDQQFSGVISGNINLAMQVVTGTGLASNGLDRETFNAQNTYAGTTTVGAGGLRIGISNALPDTGLTVNGSGVISSVGGAAGQGEFPLNAVLDLNGFNQRVAELAGTNTTTAGFIQNQAVNTSSTLTIDGGSNANLSAASSFGGTIRDNNNGAGGTVALAVQGSEAVLTLANAAGNTYSGGTTVGGGGFLYVNNTTGSGVGSGAVTVNSGKLGGTGFISNSVTMNSGSQLSPGVASGTNDVNSAVGMLTVGGLNLASGSSANFDLSAGTYDQVVSTNGVTLGGPVTIDLFQPGSASKYLNNGVFTLFSATNGSTVPSLPTVLADLSVGNPANNPNTSNPGTYQFGVSGQTITLTISGLATSANWVHATGGSWGGAPESSFWSSPTAPGLAGDSAVFGTNLTTSGSVTLDGNRTAGAVTFNNSVASYNIAPGSPVGSSLIMDGGGTPDGSNPATITDSAGTHSISANVSLTSNTTISATGSGATLTLSGVIGGAGGLSVGSGLGTVILNGTSSNTYSSTTVASGGTLQVGDGSADGNVGSGAVSLGGTLAYNRPDTLTIGNTITGTGGTLSEIGGGTLIVTGSNSGTWGTTVAFGTVQIGAVGGSTGAIGSGPVSLTGNLDVENINAGGVTIAGSISGAGSLTQNGSGILTLSGANTNFSGLVAINAGATLNLGNASSTTATGTGNITLTNATLTESAATTQVGDNGTTAATVQIMTFVGTDTINTGTGTLTLANLLSSSSSSTTINRSGGTGTLSLGVAGNSVIGVSVAPAPPNGALLGNFNNTSGSILFTSRGAASSNEAYSFTAPSGTISFGAIGATIDFGSLSGSQPMVGGTTTARVASGFLGTSTTYSGVIGSSNGTAIGMALLGNLGGSTPAPTLTLSGQNMYSGQAFTNALGAGSIVVEGTLIAGSTADPSGNYGPFGPPSVSGTPNYVLIGNGGEGNNTASPAQLILYSASVLANPGMTVANPMVVSGGGSLTTTSYTLTLGGTVPTGGTAGTSTFSGGVTLENNVTVTSPTGGTLNLTGGIVGTDADTGPDSLSVLDHGFVGSPQNAPSSNNAGFQLVSFSGPGSTVVSASTNATNAYGIYDDNDPALASAFLINGGSGPGSIYEGQNGLISVSVTGGTTTFASLNQYSGGTSVSAGKLIFGNLPAVGSTPGVRSVSALNISGGVAQVATAGSANGSANGARNVLVLSNGWSIPAAAYASASNAVVANPVAAPALTISGSGSLDLTNNDMIVQSGSSGESVFGTVSTAGTIENLVATGRGSNGAWTGTGITSSAAAASPTTMALAAVINDTNQSGSGALGGALVGTAGFNHGSSTFDGQTVNDGDILVKYTYYGDALLNGNVTAGDYLQIDNAYSFNQAHPSTPLTGWYNGDFNYDGKINGDDYTLIDNAFNSQGSVNFAGVSAGPAEMIASDTDQIAAAPAASVSSVPEPATLGMLGIGAAGMLLRRRRRNA